MTFQISEEMKTVDEMQIKCRMSADDAKALFTLRETRKCHNGWNDAAVKAVQWTNDMKSIAGLVFWNPAYVFALTVFC